MSTLFSGLSETACRDFVGSDFWDAHALRWCPPQELAEHASGAPLVWLYRAPWSGCGLQSAEASLDSGSWLARWLEQNHGVLNMREKFSDSLLLVNADRVRPVDLRSRLAGKTLTEQPLEDQPANPLASCEGLLGHLFDWSAPRYWEVFEALEAVSWLPSGEPLFRGTGAVDKDQLGSLLDLLRSQLRTSGELHQPLTAVDHQQLEQQNNELKQEGELLLLQLHQVQEELEQYYLKNLDLDKELSQGQKALAATKKDLATATRDLASTKKTLADTQRNVKAQRLQMQQMQDELRHQQALLTASRLPPPGKPTKFTRLVPSPARRMLSRTRTKKERLAQLDAIRKSSWFDYQWYLDTYPDVRSAKIDPALHYLTTGWKESRNPCSGFDTNYYLRSNPDITESGLNPLWHFIAFGSKEGRLPRKP